MVRGKGSPDDVLTREDVIKIIAEGTPKKFYAGKRVLVLTPDATRTCPLPMMVAAVQEVIAPETAKLDYMVALGSHHPMSQEQIMNLYGVSPVDRKTTFSDASFLNHEWKKPETFAKLGTFTEAEIAETTDGLFKESVVVDINKAIYDYDGIIILGPVFPHEVVGFSGGNKYFFPGISGGEFLQFFHWLSGVITTPKVIGIKDTPTRALVEAAAKMITVPTHTYAMVVKSKNELSGLYAGPVPDAWSQAADLSAKVHIRYTPKRYHTVFGVAPEMYDEMWVGGKVMYKLNEVVEDGGRLIIYAPHIKEWSSTWGNYLERVGYHTRDYLLAHMDELSEIPRGVLAHSCHVRGTGTMENGVEKPRIDVVLASSIPKESTEAMNLSYLDPAKVDVDSWRNREEEGILFVDHAGEVLHKPAAGRD